MRRLLYVAGPYRAPRERQIVVNVRRAVALGHLASAHGFSPITPHVMGFHGALGPGEEIPMECGLAMAEWVARSGGNLWIILKHDGTMSDGTLEEHSVFLQNISGPPDDRVLALTWDRWRPRFTDRDLRELWAAAKYTAKERKGSTVRASKEP